MRPLVGADRRALVDDLVLAFDAVAAGDGPRAISIEAGLGLGKTRLIQEFYGRLATTRQGPRPYWPQTLGSPGASGTSVLQARKQIEPSPGWVIPGGAEIPWLWWGISCQLSQVGHPMRSMKDASDQLRVHLDPLQAKLERSQRTRDDALEVLGGVFDLIGVVNPGAAVDAGSRWLGVVRRVIDRRNEDRRAAMDRRVEGYGESYVEAGRIADALTGVARSGTPVVLIVDDAQWADPALVSLLRHLLSLDGAAILVVATAWPDRLAVAGPGQETYAGLLEASRGQALNRLRRVAIDRLTDRDLAEVVISVAPRTDLESAERVAAVASGNPLVLDLLLELETVRADIAADGRIDTDPATLRRLPSNLRSIYQGLWDQLASPERRVLTLLAIQGPEFLPGVVDAAALRLRRHHELVPAFAALSEGPGWIRAVNDDLLAFAEYQRWEVADDVVHEVWTETDQTAIQSAMIDHILELKASSRWPGLDLRTRRIALESHIDLNERLGEAGERDVSALAESMEQLAALELDAGDVTKAGDLLERSRRLRAATGVEVATGAAEVEALAREIEATAIEEAGPVPPVSGQTDEWGREPWVAWTPHPIPAITDTPPSELGRIICEVVAVEGPVAAGRVYRSLVTASGAKRQGRRIRSALDGGVRSAVRRGALVATIPDAGGASERRILRLPDQPDVRPRLIGERPLEEVPSGEFAALARAIVRREPGLDRQDVKRRMLPLIGLSNLTPWVDGLLEQALPGSLAAEAGAEDVVATEDEYGRRPWVAWESIEIGPLPGRAPREIADLIEGVVAVEGPVMVVRVTDLLRAASGAPRVSKSITEAIESGIGSGVRRGSLVVASGRRGEPGSRVMRLPSQAQVVLRTAGPRDPWTIPPDELAELSRRVGEHEPGLDRADIKRRVGEVLGYARHTAALDALLESAIEGSASKSH